MLMVAKGIFKVLIQPSHIENGDRLEEGSNYFTDVFVVHKPNQAALIYRVWFDKGEKDFIEFDVRDKKHYIRKNSALEDELEVVKNVSLNKAFNDWKTGKLELNKTVKCRKKKETFR